MQGGDVAVEVEIELSDVIDGREVKVEYEAIETCATCKGNQAKPGTPIVTCEKCGGGGRLRVGTRTVLGTIERVMACDRCEGSGKTFETPCDDCDGKGRVRVDREVSIDIPAGIADGQQVRVGGRGHAGAMGGPPGDLYVVVRVAEDDRFHREGSELYTVIELPVHEAALGTSIEIDTLDGPQTVEVEAGTGHGDQILLDEHGLPSIRGRGRGKLHAVVNLTVPRNLTEEQRDILERFSETITEDNLREPGSGSLLSRLRKALG
jgi:molecular chaperone DnaJ